MKKKQRNQGITLIALVVTIVVLLILAGITINLVMSDNGIFKTANQAGKKTEQAEAREKLLLALGNAQILKYAEGLTDEKLDGKLNEIGQVDEEDNTIVTVNGYRFRIDREKLIIIEDLGEDNGIEISYTITGNDEWTKEPHNITIAVTLKSNNGTLDTSSIRVMKDGEDITSSINITSGAFTLTTNESSIYTVSAKNMEGKQVEQTINVNAKIDNIVPTVETVNVTTERLKLKISAIGEDNESGIKQFNYTITSTEDTTLAGIPADKRNGIFSPEETIEITATKEAKYTITVTAVDNCDNTSVEKIAEVTTIDGLTIAQAKELVNEDTLQQYIGTKVAYSPKLGGTWRVFYYDAEDDGNGNGYFGPSNTLYLKRDGGAKGKLDAYQGYSASEEGIAIMKRMNPKWRDYPTANANTINLANERVVSWLCDPVNWRDYQMSDYSSFAMGTPSVEMYIKAYNVYKKDDSTGEKLFCVVQEAYGYRVSNEESALKNFQGNSFGYVNDKGPNRSFCRD